MDVQEKTYARGKDAALVYLENHIHENAVPIASEVELRRIRSKADRWVMPFLFLCYTLNTVDKILLNLSAVMGINQELKLKGNDFSNAATSFWVAVAVTALFSTVPLQKVPTAKWAGICLVCWGISTASHAAVRNFTGLVVVRVFSGVFEASLPSAIVLLSSQYYTRREQSTRYAFWYMGLGIGQIIGSLLSFAFQHVSSAASFASWRIMFLTLGLFTLFVGVAVYYVVPNTPMEARFLSADEKVTLLEHIKVNQTGIKNAHWVSKEVFEALLSVPYWLFFAAIMMQTTGGGVLSAYSATLLKNFGYTSQQAALLNMPSGAMNIISMLYTGFGTRKFGNRAFFAISTTAVGITGASLLAFMPARDKAGRLAGLYLVNFLTGATPLTYQWFLGNTAGHTKRAFAAATTNLAFALGNIIGTLTYKAKDAPDYKPAKVDLLIFMSCSVVCLATVTVYYVVVNKRRGLDSRLDKDIDDKIAYAGMTDVQNKHFRYSY